MAKTLRMFIPFGLALIAAGCAAHPDPIIDTKGVDPQRLAEDWDECEAYTDEIVLAKGIGKGAAVGAAVGAATGAVSDHREVGEAAGIGAIYGGTRSGLDADREKQKVFKNCMRGRGYRVLN
jgi:outer membrane lipoprotein SlyB